MYLRVGLIGAFIFLWLSQAKASSYPLIPTKALELGPQSCERAQGCNPRLSVPIACPARWRVGNSRQRTGNVFGSGGCVHCNASAVGVENRVLLGIASFSSRHTAGWESSLLWKAGSQCSWGGTVSCTFMCNFREFTLWKYIICKKLKSKRFHCYF